MKDNVNIGPYLTLVKEGVKIADAIEKYSVWDKNQIIGDKKEGYTIENHLEYLEKRRNAFARAMEILEENRMGMKS